MFKKLLTTTLLLLFIQSLFSQNVVSIQESVKGYFNEIKAATKKHQQIWSTDLYAPIIFVNPGTRQIFSNFSDTAGILSQAGEIYSGILPNEINIANTAINWNGRRWAMIMLPLPVKKQDRTDLLAHELFHVSQPSLGFQTFNTDNNHLDKKDGRIYLRLELEALGKAIQTTNKTERKIHITNALTFRKYRYILYPGADSTENMLELNEGMAEYTGLMHSGRNKKQAKEHFEQSMNTFLSNPTFVRSFAYQTIPLYGYLLFSTNNEWNKEITIKSNLANYFIKSFGISLPNDLKSKAGLVLNQYNGEIIISEENAREEKTKRLIAEYKSKFITQPHFELVFERMNMSFNPSDIMPVEDKGTVYPTIRVTDNWGILKVENGALMSPGWDKISVTIPVKYEHGNISGDGWSLELKDSYSVTKDENTGNYKLSKKQ